jgi:hypothetical protein
VSFPSGALVATTIDRLVRLADGATVNLLLGATVGLSLPTGALVGTAVGRVVGLAVGAIVGLILGATVCSLFGASVGWTTGAAVGPAVFVQFAGGLPDILQILVRIHVSYALTQVYTAGTPGCPHPSPKETIPTCTVGLESKGPPESP